MISKNQTLWTVAMIAATSQAEIVSTAFWNSHNLINTSYDLGVENGIAYGLDDATDEMIKSGQSLIGHDFDYASQENVVRVTQVFPQSVWDSWVPNADAIYSYDTFLRAVGKFPFFCGETNGPLGYDLNDTCKREIVSLFTHIKHNSDGLVNIGSAAAGDLPDYSARGPLGLAGVENYKAFSKAFYEGNDRSAVLGDNPEHVSVDGYVSMSAALWQYMTKQSSATNPSAHQIMTGFFEPNS